MQTHYYGSSKHAAQSGFTMVELLVVLAIIVIGMSVITIRLTVPGRVPKPLIVSFLEKRQAAAVVHGSAETIYESEYGLVSDFDDARIQFPTGTKLVVQEPSASAHLTQHRLVKFFPDGTATLAIFTIITKTLAQPSSMTESVVKIDPIYGTISFRKPF